MTIESLMERIAVAFERMANALDLANKSEVTSEAPVKSVTKGKPRKGSTTAEEKSAATDAVVVPASGSTEPDSAQPSTASAAASTPAVTPDPPADVVKVDTKITLEVMRGAVQAYRAKKYPGDPLATEKVQDELEKLVGVRKLGDIKGEDYAKVVEAFKVAA